MLVYLCRNFLYLHDSEPFHSGICGNLGSRDKRKNFGGNPVLLYMRMSSVFFFPCSIFLLLFMLGVPCLLVIRLRFVHETSPFCFVKIFKFGIVRNDRVMVLNFKSLP